MPEVRIPLDVEEHREFIRLKNGRSWKECLKDGVSQTGVKGITSSQTLLEYGPELARQGFKWNDEIKELLGQFVKFQRRKAGV